MRLVAKLVILVCLFAFAGCPGLKDQQLKPIVGDNVNKTYRRNVAAERNKIPEGNRVMFDNAQEAEAAGYTAASSQPSAAGPQDDAN